MKVGLIFGGNTSEGEVSKWSASSVRAALVSLGYDFVDIEFDNNIIQNIILAKPDVVFNCMHGEYGEDGRLPAVLDVLKIPYTHSGVLASAIGMNKNLQKQLFAHNNIPIIEGVHVTKNELLNFDIKDLIGVNKKLDLNKKFIIKPNQDGSSRGVEMIDKILEFDFKEYLKKQNNSHFLIEERVYGREINVAIFQGKAIDFVEVIPQKGQFFNFESKYTSGGAKHIFPDDISSNIREKILVYAEKINQIVGASDISRIEFMLTNDNAVYTLEINTHPGFTSMSLVPEVLAKYNISYNQIVKTLIKNAKYNK
jgi:D-alanine-D-alanine ligase